jgi:hypothetical protein
VGILSIPDKWRDEDDMIRALCPVCHHEHPIRNDGRIEKHRRATRNNNERSNRGTDWFKPGMPCEGSGMLAHKPRVA